MRWNILPRQGFGEGGKTSEKIEGTRNFNEVDRKSRKDKFEKAEDLLEKKQSLKDFKQSTIQSIEQNMKDKVDKRYKRKLKARDLLNEASRKSRK